MPATSLDHYTIRCRDLVATRKFYEGVLGLKVGARPNFTFAGYWLYCGNSPVVHLVARDGAVGSIDDHETTGHLDHIAFRADDFETMRKTLQASEISFRENEVPDFKMRQLFLRDPDGIMVEVNFYG